MRVVVTLMSWAMQEILAVQTVPSHPLHTYTESGLTKLNAWQQIWEQQRREDSGDAPSSTLADGPEYSQGSRGKSIDHLRDEY